jgi:hypothetical protein
MIDSGLCFMLARHNVGRLKIPFEDMENTCPNAALFRVAKAIAPEHVDLLSGFLLWARFGEIQARSVLVVNDVAEIGHECFSRQSQVDSRIP